MVMVHNTAFHHHQACQYKFSNRMVSHTCFLPTVHHSVQCLTLGDKV